MSDPAATHTDSNSTPAARPRMLDFRSGGYALLIAFVLCAMIVTWQVAFVLGTGCTPAIGDGRNPDTYGFRLDNLLVDRAVLAASGQPKDGLAALVEPPHVTPDEVAALNESMRGHYLVSSDRVVGVTINGEARCWPIVILQWHEVVNDTVGGVPVLVCFSAYSDCAVVLERHADQTFGHSGLMWNHTPLIFDRHAAPGTRNPEAAARESLWSPLQARAVAGPAADAGARMRILPAQFVTWSWWHAHHPDTRVMVTDTLAQWCATRSGKPLYDKRYARDPFHMWYASPKLEPQWPVAPMPPDADDPARPLKAGAVAVRVAGMSGEWLDVAYADVAARADADGVWRTAWQAADGTAVPLVFTHEKSVIGRPSVAVEVDASRLPATTTDPPPALMIVHAFRFALFATRERATARTDVN
ncbi:MAG: DUF3179 domain-containing (seleno)protein [Planctomycetota bacterium]